MESPPTPHLTGDFPSSTLDSVTDSVYSSGVFSEDYGSDCSCCCCVSILFDLETFLASEPSTSTTIQPHPVYKDVRSREVPYKRAQNHKHKWHWNGYKVERQDWNTILNRVVDPKYFANRRWTEGHFRLKYYGMPHSYSWAPEDPAFDDHLKASPFTSKPATAYQRKGTRYSPFVGTERAKRRFMYVDLVGSQWGGRSYTCCPICSWALWKGENRGKKHAKWVIEDEVNEMAWRKAWGEEILEKEYQESVGLDTFEWEMQQEVEEPGEVGGAGYGAWLVDTALKKFDERRKKGAEKDGWDWLRDSGSSESESEIESDNGGCSSESDWTISSDFDESDDDSSDWKLL